MPERIDPLGKRALFWAPGPDHDDDPPGPVVRTPRQAAERRAGAGARRARRATGSAAPGGPVPAAADRRSGAPLGKRALYSAPDGDVGHGVPGHVARRAGVPGAGVPGAGVPGVVPSGVTAVQLHCATCGACRSVDLLHYARLHLPVFVWRPGRGFTRFMTCPSCRRRAWISASWPAPPTPAPPTPAPRR